MSRSGKAEVGSPKPIIVYSVYGGHGSPWRERFRHSRLAELLQFRNSSKFEIKWVRLGGWLAMLTMELRMFIAEIQLAF
jgi:hypothetical protein